MLHGGVQRTQTAAQSSYVVRDRVQYLQAGSGSTFSFVCDRWGVDDLPPNGVDYQVDPPVSVPKWVDYQPVLLATVTRDAR